MKIKNVDMKKFLELEGRKTPIADMAKELGLTEAQLDQYRERAGLQPREKKLGYIDFNMFMVFRDKGKTNEYIASYFGVPLQDVEAVQADLDLLQHPELAEKLQERQIAKPAKKEKAKPTKNEKEVFQFKHTDKELRHMALDLKYTNKDIAGVEGTNAQTVSRKLLSMGIRRKAAPSLIYGNVSQKLIDNIIKDIDSGLSDDAIERKYKLPDTSIRILRKKGYQIPKSHWKRNQSPEACELIEAIRTDVTVNLLNDRQIAQKRGISSSYVATLRNRNNIPSITEIRRVRRRSLKQKV